MTEQVRAITAYIAGSLISGKLASAIYDYSTGIHILISGNLTKKLISIFDHTHSCHISGAGDNGQYSLYHYGESTHISLNIIGAQFSGYDYGSGSHFGGQVSGQLINLYDYAAGQYFSFSI